MLFSALTCPIPHNWYLWLDSVILPEMPTSPQAIAAKVALDQLILAPAMLLVFFVTMRVMEEISSARIMPNNFYTQIKTKEGDVDIIPMDPTQILRKAIASATIRFWPSLRFNYFLW